MGIMPIGPLVLLPLSNSAGLDADSAPMARVERSERSEDETYSASNGDGDPQPGSHEHGNEAQDYELLGDGLSMSGEASDVETSLTERSAGAAPMFDLPPGSPAKISFFA